MGSMSWTGGCWAIIEKYDGGQGVEYAGRRRWRRNRMRWRRFMAVSDSDRVSEDAAGTGGYSAGL